MTGPPGAGQNPYQYPVGSSRKRTRRRLYSNLQKVPGIVNVRLGMSDTGIECNILGDVDSAVFAEGVVPCDEARVKVNWWPQPAEDPPWFKFHYWDENGFDCGWHRHMNDHVDGMEHYQYRTSSDEEYSYESVEFEAGNPVGVLWEVIGDRLPERLQNYYR